MKKITQLNKDDEQNAKDLSPLSHKSTSTIILSFTCVAVVGLACWRTWPFEQTVSIVLLLRQILGSPVK